MTWTDNYLDVTADLFSDIHVIIEGAIALFENDTGPSFTCAPKKRTRGAHSFQRYRQRAVHPARTHDTTADRCA